MYRFPLSSVLLRSKPIPLLHRLVVMTLLTWSGIGLVQAGELEYIDTYGGAGLGGSSNLAVSPDNRYIYVAAATDKKIGWFKREANGQPSYLDSYNIKDLRVPVKVSIAPDGSHLYAVIRTSGKDIVALYDRNQESGSLSLNSSYEVLDNVTDLVISRDGKNLYLSGGDSVVVFDLNLVTGALTSVETKSDGIAGVDGLAGSSSLALTPDGKYLFVAGATDNAVAVFSRDTSSGRVTFVDLLRGKGVGGASSLALSPDGINLYVAGTTDNAVAVFKRDYISGKVTYLEAWTKDKVPALDAVTSVIASPNGSRLYASSGAQSAIAIFNTIPQSGKLESMGVEKWGGNGVSSLALTPNGAYLYAVVPDNAGNVSLFRTANRKPTPVDDTAEIDPGSVILQVLANDTDPDNDALYVASADSRSIQGGSVVINSDNTLTYTAPDGFFGNDSFSYMVSDVRDALPVVAQVNLLVKNAASSPAPVETVSGTPAAGSGGGGGSLDGWFGMLLISVLVLRGRVAR